MNRKLLILIASAGLFSCGPDFTEEGLGTDIEFEPDRPQMSEEKTVAPYSGSDPYVVDAQQRYRTGLDIQQKVIYRTCTPFDGVCHNKKEYPDLHTPANFIESIGAPCNVDPGDYTSVWDRCEPRGDRFSLDQFDAKIEVAWVELVEGEAVEFDEENPPDETSPGLHIMLRKEIPMEETSVGGNARFYRDFNGDELTFARFRTQWWKVGPKRLLGVVDQDRIDDANQLVNAGIRQGDQNRNGEFGREKGKNIPMINPGKPEKSYLIGRIRGQIDGTSIPGSRMPLANQPLDIADMLALFCFIEGLEEGEQPNLADAIDYNACSYAEDPESLNLLGEGVTYATRISKILEANCGGCHGGANPSEQFDIVTEGAYDRLLEPSVQNPDMNLIEPGSPEESYLWLKLTGDDSITGDPMPVDPLMGTRTLSEAEMGDIETWIINGAIENE
jgi:hypothetical protein